MNELMKVKTNDGKELRITSVELVDIINQFREIEAGTLGNKAKVLAHGDFSKKIRKELEVLKSLGLDNQGNISLVEYIDKKGETRPCYSLNRDGMLQMLNSESTLVRYKTIEYINKLEKELTQPKLPQTYKEALYALIEAEEEKERLMLENEQQKTTIKEITTHALTIEDSRKVINKLVRTMAMVNYHGNFKDCWSALYTKYNYLCGTNIKNRKRAQGVSLLSVLSEDETFQMEKIVKSWCTDNNIDIDKELKLI